MSKTNVPPNKKFGDMLTAARERLGLSMADVVAGSNVGMTSLYLMEGGKPCNPTLRTLANLCHVLDLDIAELVEAWEDVQ